jgi:uncharacterized membrane protein YhaH (DUF805 family)
MDWVWYLFSFDGRINRAKMWLAGLVIGCWMIFLFMLLFLPIGYLFGWPEKFHFGIDDIFAVFDPRSYRGLSRSDIGSIIVHAAILPQLLWVFLATAVKRLHDRDRSGWWMVPFFFAPELYRHFQELLGGSFPATVFGNVSPILYTWGIVELYFLRGTRWTNRFGPNPLGKQQMRRRSPAERPRATTAWDQQSEIEMAPHTGSPPPGMHVNRGA